MLALPWTDKREPGVFVAMPILSLNVLKTVPAEYAVDLTSSVEVAIKLDVVVVAWMY